jgi:GntP family gluconate:H+ symporter
LKFWRFLRKVVNLSGIFHDPVLILLVSLFVVVASILYLRIGAFLSLLAGALTVSFWAAAIGDEPFNPIRNVNRVCEAMGTTVGKIGVLIVLGTIIGKCMTDSGAADRIVLACRQLVGEKRLPVALASSAFILSIPVFYDATFYLLLPLAKSIYRAFRKNYILYLLSIGLGATISHTIIPPTPGPIAVADAFNIPLATSLKIGLFVGVCLLPVALVLAWLLNKVLPNPKIAPNVLMEMGLDAENEGEAPSDNSLALSTSASNRSLPSLWLSFAPIVLPVILIAGASIVEARLGKIDSNVAMPAWRGFVALLGNANVALAIAAFFAAVPLLWSRKNRTTRSQMEEKLNFALLNAGMIVMITAAGGSYGEMLRVSGIGNRIEELFVTTGELSGVTALTLAFLSTALLKSAQGSSTTAMITSAGIFSAMGFTSEALGFNIAYLAVTIGAGSCVVSWMNDSGFCVFSRSSGVAEVDCLKVWTLGTGLLGVAGFGITLVLSHLFPMI